MNYITRNILKIIFILIGLIILAVIYEKTFSHIVLSNLSFNIVILALFFFGVIITLKNLFKLKKADKWLEDLFNGKTLKDTPQILSHLSGTIKTNKTKKGFSLQQDTKHILEITEDKIHSQKTLPQYIVNTLVLLGLLGTFWGLIITIGSISGIINNINIDPNQSSTIMQTLKSSFSEPIGGMSLAFSSSLLGLGSSLILSLILLISNLTHSNFYNKIEEILFGASEVGSENQYKDAEALSNALPYITALTEQNAEILNKMIKVTEKNNEINQKNIDSLKLASSYLMQTSVNVEKQLSTMNKALSTNEKLIPILQDLAEKQEPIFNLDEETTLQIKSINENIKDLNRDFENNIKVLSKTIEIKAQKAVAKKSTTKTSKTTAKKTTKKSVK